MSLESLSSQESVTVSRQTASTGAAWGQSTATESSRTLVCRVETLGAREIQAYQARGQNATHRVMFYFDPAITKQDIIAWGDKTLKVVDAYQQGRPGELMLWIVDCDHETTR
jgi:hypothetical protein